MSFWKPVITLFTLFIFSGNLHAQDKITTVSGVVVDGASAKPVEFATVQLLHNTDSSILETTVTDSKGKFSFENVASRNYILTCTFIGYEKSTRNFSVGSDQQKLNVGTVAITPLATTMADVTVSTEKAMLTTSIDRKTYNVGQDIMAQSGSISDILKNIPSVEVDMDGQISLRGSENVMVLIDGRASTLTGKSSAELLQQLPANTIDRIEVITNPSAKYRPDGTAGIINIVLKKNAKGGWNGSATASVGNDDRYNAGINFNVKSKKIGLSGGYNFRQDARIRYNNADRIYFDSSNAVSRYNTEYYESFSLPVIHNITLGIDYTLSNHDRLGISNNYVNRKSILRDIQNQSFYDADKILINNYDRLRYDPETKIENNATAFWEHAFSKKDHEVKVEFNASTSDEEEDNRYTNLYHADARPSTFDNARIKEAERQQQLSVDYSNPLTKTSKIEAGYLGLFSQQDFDFYSEYFDTALTKFMVDVTKTNRFLYNESIHALYTTFLHSYKKFSYSAGLRGEQVLQKGNLVTKNSFFENNYFKLYPTLHLAYELKNGQIQLSYSKRVNRPEGDDLNPFPKYRDPRNLQAGNPELLPEMIHSVEFGYKWQNKNFSFVPSVYYRNKRNGFTQVIVPLNDSVLLTTRQNLSTDQAAGLELIFTAKAGKFLSANLGSNVFYNEIDATKLGYSGKKSIYSMSFNFNSTLTFTKTTRMQISCNYRSARLTPQGKVYPNFVLNTGVQQAMFKRKLFLTLTVADLLQTLQQKIKLETTFVNQTTISRRNGRIIFFGVNYRFGKAAKKPTEEKFQYDDNL